MNPDFLNQIRVVAEIVGIIVSVFALAKFLFGTGRKAGTIETQQTSSIELLKASLNLSEAKICGMINGIQVSIDGLYSKFQRLENDTGKANEGLSHAAERMAHLEGRVDTLEKMQQETNRRGYDTDA